MNNIEINETTDVLNIHRLEQLSEQLDISVTELMNVSQNITNHYRVQEINNNGKQRQIYLPSPQLKNILKAIDMKLSIKIRLPEAMHGARKGYSFISNASKHTAKKYVFNIDIEDFYPSIKPKPIYNVFLKKLNCSHSISRLLVKLCTADEHLPQGYNTSPRLANLVLLPAVRRIGVLCDIQGLTFSIYADDITISGNKNPVQFSKTINKILAGDGFKINKDKTICMTNFKKQKVTSIVVNEKLNIDKADYKDLRAKIYICCKYGASRFLGDLKNKKGETLYTADQLKSHFAGKLSHHKRINEKRIVKLNSMFNIIKWGLK